MAFDLRSIKRGVEMAPPRIVLFGPQGIGKTTFGAQAPAPIILPFEDGIGTLDVPRFPLIKTWDDMMGALISLANEPHEFATAVIDTLDWLEPIVYAKTCAAKGWSDIEAPGYGKGYGAAEETWREFFDALNFIRESRKMSIILLAHTEIKAFQDPTTDPYDRYQVKLQKRAAALCQEWADCVLFANFRTYTTDKDTGFNKKVTRGVGTGERVLYTEERPGYHAKNRYGLPSELPFSYAAFQAALTNQPKA